MDTIRIFADASVRDRRTGIGYCLKAWNDGRVTTLDSGQKAFERGMKTTHAEYRGLLYAIEQAEGYEAKTAVLHTDSKSIAWAIRTQSHNEAHVEYVGRITNKMQPYDDWRAIWTPRTSNQTAHKKSRLASSTPSLDSAES